MANLGSTVNVDEIAERSEFTPLPAGQYNMMIVNSEMKPTQSGGEQLVLEMDVQNGEYKGRKLFVRLNLKNANEKAQDIAFRELGELCRALGKKSVSDSTELHNKRFVADVKVTPAKGDYGPGNAVKKYISMTEASAAAATPPASGGYAADLDDDIPF